MNLAAASTFHWQTLAQWQFEDESAASVPSVLLFYVPVQWGVCGGGFGHISACHGGTDPPFVRVDRGQPVKHNCDAISSSFPSRP